MMTEMLYVKADDESILPYSEEVQRRQAVFMPLDLSIVVLGIGISYLLLLNSPACILGSREDSFSKLYPPVSDCASCHHRSDK